MNIQTAGKQKGITLLGFILVMAVVGVFAFLGIRLLPVYVEYYSVVTDLKAACNEAGPSGTIEQVRGKLDLRFDVSYVTSVDLKKHVKMIKDGDKKSINIAYEVRKPLIYNLDFVAKFDVTVPMVGGSAL
jgi:hypothetical protein